VLSADQLDLPIALRVAALPTRRLIGLQVGLNVCRGNSHRQRDLQRLERLAPEKDLPREVQTALHRMQRIINLAGDLQGLAARNRVTNQCSTHKIPGHTRANLQEEDVYTVEQAAERLSISRNTVVHWIALYGTKRFKPALV
jgi:hypothetical protein